MFKHISDSRGLKEDILWLDVYNIMIRAGNIGLRPAHSDTNLYVLLDTYRVNMRERAVAALLSSLQQAGVCAGWGRVACIWICRAPWPERQDRREFHWGHCVENCQLAGEYAGSQDAKCAYLASA